jgi:hypothetical protein
MAYLEPVLKIRRVPRSFKTGSNGVPPVGALLFRDSTVLPVRETVETVSSAIAGRAPG